jgi:hypothetical protein
MTPLKNETAKAFHAFQIYRDLGPKRSLAKVARKLGISRQLIERWSRQHSWQKRIRALMIADAERSARAAEQAALNIAEEKERLALRHAHQKLKASERLFERAHEILKESTHKSRAPDAAKMFAVAAALGNEALGLEGTAQTAAFGLRPTAQPIIRVVLRRDAQSEQLKKNEDEFLRRHPEFRGSRNRIGECR